MRRTLAGTLAAACLLSAGSAHAQWETGSTLVTLNVGYVGATSELSDETLHGGTVNGSIEYVVPDQPVAIGLLVSFITGDETLDVPIAADSTAAVNVSVHSFPMYLTSKFWFGGSRVRGYAGMGLGIQSMSVEQSSPETGYSVQTHTSLAVGIPLGLAVFLSDVFFVNGYGMLNLFGNNSAYSDNWNATASLGIGFKV